MNKSNIFFYVIIIFLAITTGLGIYNWLKPDVPVTIRYERNKEDQAKIDSLVKGMSEKDKEILIKDRKLDSLGTKLHDITERRKQNKSNYKKELEEIENTSADSLADYIRRQLKQ
ncbi:MAG: hypothetical protein IT280_13405 [Ignavibacteria bacterium]|nr:hypothetical protein [Ignavibacteria bacterium]